MAYLGRKGQTAPLASADLPTNSISTAHLINDAVTSAKIGVDVIVAEDIAANAITVAEIADDAVTGAKLANDIAISTTGAIAGGNATFSTADNTDTLTVISTDADSGSAPNLDFYRNSSSPADGDGTGKITFRGRNDNSQDVDFATIDTWSTDVSDGSEDGEFVLRTMQNGSSTNVFAINNTEIKFNEQSLDLDFRVESDNSTHALFVQGSDGKVGIGTDSPAYPLHTKVSANSYALVTERASGAKIGVWHGTSDASIGTITSTNLDIAVGGSTKMTIDTSGKIFASGLGSETGHTALGWRSSDSQILKLTSSRRFKSDIVDTTFDSSKINSIKCRDFTWTETGNKYIGLIAEEVHEHIPKAVTMGTEDGEPVCESVDYHSLTALLIDYSQKLEQRVIALENA